MSNIPELPNIAFIDTDPQQIINDILNYYTLTTGRTLEEGDPLRLFLLSLGYIIASQNLRLEKKITEQFLAYATGEQLDHIAALRQVVRKPAEKAVATVRFSLSAVRPGAVLIPAGTRVSAGSEFYFEVTESADIPAGSLFIDLDVRAITAGVEGNGFLVGDISILVDPIAFIQSVSNINESQGGDDIESDDALRDRVYYAPTTYSVAGTMDSYRTLAKSASSLISSVAAFSPSPGVAKVVVLLENGELPTPALINLVEEKLNPETGRTMCDYLDVSGPTVSTYNVNFTYYISRKNQASAAQIQAAVTAAVNDYNSWQSAEIGRDITPDDLTVRVKAAGAKRLVISSPAFAVVGRDGLGKVGSVTITYGGLEDE